MIVLKVRAVHCVALNMLRGHLRALGHSEELALGKVDIRVYQIFDTEYEIFHSENYCSRRWRLW